MSAAVSPRIDGPAATLSRAVRITAPCAALLYPAIIWAGPAISPVLLALSLLAPASAAFTALRCAQVTAYPTARRIAHVSFAAPAIFTLMGLLHDSMALWVAPWTVLIVAILRERPCERPAVPDSQTLAIAHGFSAVPVSLFTLAHLVNHLAALGGGLLHIEIMTALRTVYRHPIGETVLLTGVAFQLVSGIMLVNRKLRVRTGLVETLQSLSGVYLSFFFLSHLTAILTTYYVRGIDTNYTWLTSQSLLTNPWSARLGPYYFLAVASFTTHGAAGLHKVMRAHGATRAADRLFTTAALSGLAVAALILVALLRS